MESRIKSSMENLSDIQRDTWSGSAGLLVRSMWSQMREDRARQKATWANLPSLWTTDGMRESGGGTKCEKEGKKIKRKNELMIIEGPCDSKTFMVFAICLNKTKNESVKTPKTKQEMWEMIAMEMPWGGMKGCAREPERACEAALDCSTTTQTDICTITRAFYPLYSLSYSA